MANISPIGRVSYPNVFEPTQYEQNEPKFQITLLFDKNDPGLEEMKRLASNAVKEKWPNGAPKNLRNPFRSGDEKFEESGKGEEYKGKVYIRFQCAADRPPQIVGPDKRVITAASGQFYPGCFARVSYTIYAYQKGGNCGVAFGLCNIQKTGEGDAFDNRTSAEHDFDVVATQDGDFGF